MLSPNAAMAGGGGYSIKTTKLEDGKWQASVDIADVVPVVADREVEAIRGISKSLDTYVHGGKGRLA